MSRERDIALSEAVLSDLSTYNVTTQNRYRQECSKLEEVIRKVLRPNLETRALTRLLPKYTFIPTYYQLVKTHKLETTGERVMVHNENIKTRPIVSSCGGPTDAVSWFLQHMLSPLLSYVPAHLKNADHFLRSLRGTTIPVDSRKTYQSFDVSALYTKVDTRIAVEACINLLRQHQDSCQLYGLSIDDIEELLMNVVKFNMFRFRNNIYMQTR